MKWEITTTFDFDSMVEAKEYIVKKLNPALKRDPVQKTAIKYNRKSGKFRVIVYSATD